MSSTRPPIVTVPFLLLVGSHLLASMGYAVMVLLPLYLDELQATRSEVGGIMAVSAVGGLASRPAVGWALDRFGRKRTLAVGTFILTAGLVLLGMVQQVGLLVVVARIVIGAGIGLLFTGYFTLATDLVPESRRTEGIALFGISGLVPLAFTPLAGQLGLEPLQLRWVFPAVAVVVLASGLLMLGVPEPEPRTARSSFRLRTAWHALRAPALWPVWTATVVFAGLVSIFLAFASVTAEARQVGDPTLLWIAYAGGAIGVRLFGASLPERIGTSRMVVPALGVYVAGILVAANAHTALGFGIAGGLAGLGHGYCFPVLTAQTASRTPEAVRGSALAAFTAVWDSAGLLVVPFFGFIADSTSDGTMLWVAAGCALVGLGVWALLERSVGAAVVPVDPGSG